MPRVAAEKRHRVPLLLVFALINRPYILDLRPGNSFVEYLVERGYDVYLLDWGSPGPEDKNLKLDDYVLDYMVRADPQSEGGLRFGAIQPARLVYRFDTHHDLCGPAAR